MKTVFILQNVMTFRTDWVRLCKEIADTRFILITTKTAHRDISQEVLNTFARVFVVAFEIEAIQAAFNQAIQEFSLSRSDVRVVTHDEYAVMEAARLRERENLPGMAASLALRFRSKIAMKEALKATEICLPKYIEFNRKEVGKAPRSYAQQVIALVGLPLFIKPCAGAGSEETYIIDSEVKLLEWIMDHESGPGEYEFDELITGTLFNSTVVVIDNNVVHVEVCEHAYPNAEFIHKSKPLGNITLPYAHENYQLFRKFSLEVLMALGEGALPNGVYNVDGFIRSDNVPVFMEAAARPPGGMLAQVFRLRLGLNTEEVHFKIQSTDIKPHFSEKLFGAYFWYPFRSGTVDKISLPDLKSSTELDVRVEPGMTLGSPQSIRDYALGILLSHENYDTLRREFDLLADSQVYTLRS